MNETDVRSLEAQAQYAPCWTAVVILRPMCVQWGLLWYVLAGL